MQGPPQDLYMCMDYLSTRTTCIQGPPVHVYGPPVDKDCVVPQTSFECVELSDEFALVPTQKV